MSLPQEGGLWVIVVLFLVTAGISLSVLRYRLGRFRSEVLALLCARHPDVEEAQATPEGAILRVAGRDVRLDVASLYRSWKGRVEVETVDRLATQLRAALPGVHTPALATARPHLLPLIKPAAFVSHFAGYAAEFHLVARPFVDDLAIVYAIEGFHRITYLTESIRQAWNLPADQVHAIALANLRRRTAHLLDELGGPREVYEHLDGFEASRILVPDLITPPGSEPAVAAIPHEHLLLVAPRNDASGLAGRAAAAYKGGKYPLSPAVFQLGEASPAPVMLS